MDEKPLRRYSDIPALIYLLTHQTITLLDPTSWDDSNDSHFLALYKERKRLKSVLALCFSEQDETYHHWRVFSNGSSGVCIKFKRDRLLRAMRKRVGIKMGGVNYFTMPKSRNKRLLVKDLPFCKRHAFGDECEFRIIYESKTHERDTLDVTIPLNCIDRITLSPWIPRALATSTKRALHAIDGCEEIDIFRSTLIGNEEWKRWGESAR